MIAIVAVDKNWAIGNDNKLLTHLPTDLARFKEITREGIVVMGRRTLESLPGSDPLPLRDNVVLTRDKEYEKEGAVVINYLTDALTYLRAKSFETNQVVSIIGGQSIYEQFLPFCHQVYVTKIDYSFEEADAFFPNLDKTQDWDVREGEVVNENGFTYQYLTYSRK